MSNHDGGQLADEVQIWLNDHWDESITVREWWRRLASAGYAYPTWPVGAGGLDTSRHRARVIEEVLGRNRVVGPPVGGVAATLAAPTLLECGTSAQIAELVRPIAFGETSWCQLFSEPGSGSDLASVATRAVRDGDEWVVTGQKVWNSAADVADLGMLLARTDLDQPKHRGITYFAIDMHQPGIEVRPLRQMNGQAGFCEVFLHEARVGRHRIVGDLNGGWRTAQSTLSYERNSVASGGIRGLVAARSGSAGDLDRAVSEIIERARTAAQPVGEGATRIRGNAIPTQLMMELARQYGAQRDPVIRQQLARYVSLVRVNGWTTQRVAAARGQLTGADGSIAKVTISRICQESRELSYRIVGAAGMTAGPDSPLSGDLQVVGLASPGTRIGGGTDEIQLNVLGERALGLPRDPGDDRDVPYRRLKVGTQR
jgi:alkylation response protein AidB-like acyl-CoA dehydrogenase